MTVAEYKIEVLKEIMLVDDELVLKQIHKMLSLFLADYRKVSEKLKETEIISFEEWNKQFTDNGNLDDFIPEYDTTLGEFRKAIYEAEMGKTRPLSEFQEKLTNLYEKA